MQYVLNILTLSAFVQLLLCCTHSVSVENRTTQLHTPSLPPDLVENNRATHLINRFPPPEEFCFLLPDSNSFAFYLQHLPLKEYGSPVQYFNGKTKASKGVYCAVVDYDIGNRDLQQCADAVMRLRAEYLYDRKDFDSIHFNFLSDGQPRYYIDYVKGDYSYPMFSKYLNYVFSYANTRSLHDELNPVMDFNDMRIGDIFIQKGNPYGHAVIVVNMARNLNTGKRLYMLAQSYMPAQDIQILINPFDNVISPWYVLQEGSVKTPEWSFHISDLRRFPE